MANGGFKPGAGRPRKPTAELVRPREEPRRSYADGKARGETPIEYMLSVMQDVEADDARRDRMAIAAAPYLHEKADAPAKVQAGKKAIAQELAESAGSGTEWGDDLTSLAVWRQ